MQVSYPGFCMPGHHSLGPQQLHLLPSSNPITPFATVFLQGRLLGLCTAMYYLSCCVETPRCSSPTCAVSSPSACFPHTFSDKVCLGSLLPYALSSFGSLRPSSGFRVMADIVAGSGSRGLLKSRQVMLGTLGFFWTGGRCLDVQETVIVF